MNLALFALVAATLCVGFPLPVEAQPITFEFTASYRGPSPGEQPNPSLLERYGFDIRQSGDRISGILSYDPGHQYRSTYYNEHSGEAITYARTNSESDPFLMNLQADGLDRPEQATGSASHLSVNVTDGSNPVTSFQAEENFVGDNFSLSHGIQLAVSAIVDGVDGFSFPTSLNLRDYSWASYYFYLSDGDETFSFNAPITSLRRLDGPPSGPQEVPELDSGGASHVLALLVGIVLLLRERRRFA